VSRKTIPTLEEFRVFVNNSKLVDVVGQLLQTPEVALHPTNNPRFVIPDTCEWAETQTVHWHQDAATNDSPDGDFTNMLTAWVPLVDVSLVKGNGVMQLVKGAPDSVWKHHYTTLNGHITVDEADLSAYLEKKLGEITTVDVPAGSVLLFNNRVVHRSLPSTYQREARVSLDLRFQDAQQTMGRPGQGMVQLRSADPNFQISWVPKKVEPVPRDEFGRYHPRWGQKPDSLFREQLATRAKTLGLWEL